jgi:hypothetical protein
MGKLVEQVDDNKKSVLFASKMVLIRNSTYYILAKSIKAGFPITVAAN